jgi:hypothetical protein
LSSLAFFVNCGNEDPQSLGSGGSSTGTGSGPGAGGTINGSSGGNSGGNTTGAGGGSGNGAGGGNANSGGASGNSGGSNNLGSGGDGFDPDIDEMGQGNAKAGESTNVNQAYLKLGEIRILNNNWGSAERNCTNSAFSVFVNQDKSFGWTFDRAACGGDGSQPDFPQIEFGIHPFGIGSNLATSPEFSSTTLLPLQIKNINSASVDISNLRIELEAQQAWNITFEFWVSERDPRTPDAGVYAELMTFWGWQGGRWPTAPGADGSAEGGSGTGKQISSSGKPYTLWVQRDNWAHGWRYFQFRADDGPKNSFSGKLDVKPFLDYLVGERGYSSDFWITRLEVGSEIDDNTKGKVTLDNITFEVNGESRSAVIAD